MKKSFVSVSQLVKQERLISSANSVMFNCQRKFSSVDPSSTASNERQSLVHGKPSKEVQQLSDDILNLNGIDMHILLEIIQVSLTLI